MSEGLRDILDAATPGGKPPYRIAGIPAGIISADDYDVTDEALACLALAPELAALVLDGEDVIAGLMEIAEIAMPDSYFEDDSRTTAARLWLARLSRLGAGDSNPRHGPGRGQNEKEQR